MNASYALTFPSFQGGLPRYLAEINKFPMLEADQEYMLAKRYQETGDIYLVADVLGHKDVNTTRKHYADMDENKKRANRNAVKLREEQ